VIHRANLKGVQKLIITGGSLCESKEALDLALTNDCLYSTVGCHPTRSNEFEENPEFYFNELLRLASGEYGKSAAPEKRKIVAIGECGLDYDRLEFCPKYIQKKYFLQQFELAELTGLPMFLHNRNTSGDFIQIVRENRQRFSNGVSHSFTGSLNEALELCNLNIFIGINGCSLKTEDNLEVVSKIPAEWLMLETDSPWCDIRPSHASFKYLSAPSDVWKKKYIAGELFKGRNEPSQM
ncbi:TatD DNase, partial [Nowakowskiella sp. JEL0078]